MFWDNLSGWKSALFDTIAFMSPKWCQLGRLNSSGAVAVKHCQTREKKTIKSVCVRPCLLDTFPPRTYVKHLCGSGGVKGEAASPPRSGSERRPPASLLLPQSKYLVCRCGHVSRCSCLSLCFNRLTPGFPHQCQTNTPALIPAALRCVTDCSVSL